jgi:hypothetical protein
MMTRDHPQGDDMYKNWPTIVAEIRKRRFMKSFFIGLDPHDEFGIDFVKAFPNFFTEDIVPTSIPLSLLIQEDMQCRNRGNRDPRGISSIRVFKKYGIPYISFELGRANFTDRFIADDGVSILSEQIVCQVGFGQMLLYGNAWCVCLYAGPARMEGPIILAPSECVAIDV